LWPPRLSIARAMRASGEAMTAPALGAAGEVGVGDDGAAVAGTVDEIAGAVAVDLPLSGVVAALVSVITSAVTAMANAITAIPAPRAFRRLLHHTPTAPHNPSRNHNHQ
jgi:hypothetical protein